MLYSPSTTHGRERSGEYIRGCSKQGFQRPKQSPGVCHGLPSLRHKPSVRHTSFGGWLRGLPRISARIQKPDPTLWSFEPEKEPGKPLAGLAAERKLPPFRATEQLCAGKGAQ